MSSKSKYRPTLQVTLSLVTGPVVGDRGERILLFSLPFSRSGTKINMRSTGLPSATESPANESRDCPTDDGADG